MVHRRCSVSGLGAPRMSTEQWEAKQKLDIERDRRRLRLSMAARFLAAGLAAAGEREEIWTVDQLRQHAKGSLKVADILIEEAGR